MKEETMIQHRSESMDATDNPNLLRLAAVQPAQASPRSDEYKEVLKRAVKRTLKYAARALEATDAAITESIYSATSFAGWQVNAAREA